MKEYFNGFSTQDLVDMKRNDEKRKEKVEMKKEIERLRSIIKEVREYIEYQLENLDFEEDTKAKMLGTMVLVLLDKEKE